MDFVKRNTGFVLIVLVSFFLGGIILLTVSRIRQEAPVAPTAPTSKPQAIEGSPVPACRLSFSIILPSPVPSISPLPSPSPSSLPSPSPSSSPTPALLAAIGDYVWLDQNQNGIQDSPETGIPQVVVRLYTGTGTSVGMQMTNNSGLYQFNNLQPGDYIVEFVSPAGYTFTQPNMGNDNSIDSDAAVVSGRTQVTTLSPGEIDRTWDAGLFLASTPSPTPSPLPSTQPSPSASLIPTAWCVGLKFYQLNWTEITNLQLLRLLRPGDRLFISVIGTVSGGSFDRARFRIIGDGQVLPGTNGNPDGWRYTDTTLGNPNNEFTIEFTLPQGINSYMFESEIHHLLLGWR